MELGKLFKLQNEASQSRQQSYEKFVEDKYANVKFKLCEETDLPYKVYCERNLKDSGEYFAEVLHFFSGASVDILVKTECFRKPLSYEDAAKYFLKSRELEINSLATVKQGDATVLVMFGLDKLAKQHSFFVQPWRMLPKELQAMFSKKEVSDWYIYLVNTLTYVNIATTSFVNIDDDEKLKAAKQRLLQGEINLPLEEMAFLNYEFYPWDKEHLHFNIINRTTVTKEGAFNFQHSNPVETLPRVRLPVIDLDTLEDRLYDMFVFFMKTQDLVGADTETTGLNVYFAKIVSLGLTFNNKFGFYLSFRHTKPPKTVLDINSLSFIRRLARNASKGMYNVRNGQKYLGYLDTKSEKNLSQETAKDIFVKLRFMKTIWHNAKFDTSMIRTNYGLDIIAYMDTMIAHYVARPEFTDDRSTGKLKVIAPNELGIESWKIDVEKIQDEAKDLVAAYCARDCCYMFALALNLGDSLLQEDTWRLFQLEMDYLPLLVDAELAGIRLDAKKLKEIEKASQDKLDAVVNKVREMYEQSLDTHFDKYFENLGIFGKPFVKEKAYLAYMSDPSEENKKALKELMKAKFNLNSSALKKFFFYEIQGVIPPRKCGLCGTRNFENKDYCTNEKCKNYNVPNTAPYEFMTEKGEVSFSTGSMKVIAAGTGNDLLGELEESSHVNKLLTSFCTLDVLINPLTGNIHPCYNQARTATGRLSSSRPNFQQLPKRLGKDVRKCIVANDPDHCIISADYAGQEARILAAYTMDEKLLRAFNPCYHCQHNYAGTGEDSMQGHCEFENHEENSECNTVDIHSFITKQVYPDKVNVPISKLKEYPELNKLRTICKSVTFGLAYGSSPKGLSESTGITLDEAKEVFDLYYATFPGVKAYIDEAQQYVDKHGEIMDMVGRKRKFLYAGWDVKEKEDYYETNSKGELSVKWIVKGKEEDGSPSYGKSDFRWPKKKYSGYVSADLRKGTNFPIQGLAASMTKLAAIELSKEFKAHPSWDAKIVQFVHDEVVVHASNNPDTLRKVIAAIEDCMVNRINMPSHCVKNHPLKWKWPAFLPMSVEAEVGDSYGSIMDPEKYIKIVEERT